MMNAPCETKIPVSANGTYAVNITVTATQDTEYIILCESRRWLCEGTLAAGQKAEHTFTVNVCDIHKFGTEYVKKDCLTIGVMGNVEYSCTLEACDVPTIYIAGDSTVTDQPAEYPYNPASTYCGWGQMFPLYLTPGIAVSNHAQSGSTTAEFMQANWEVVRNRLKPGDFMVIEFGHNDQKQEELAAYTGYTKNLEYYINEVRARKALPILCSPINRIIFEPDGTLKNLLGEYRDAVKATAERMCVPFIDLWSRTTEYMEAAGPEDAWDYFWGDGKTRDYTHTNDIGGKLIAKFVAQEIQKAGIMPIAGHIKTECINTPLPKPSGKKNQAENINDYRTVGLVNLPDLDKDITNI